MKETSKQKKQTKKQTKEAKKMLQSLMSRWKLILAVHLILQGLDISEQNTW